MHYRTATLSDLDRIVEAWVSLADHQREHGSLVDPDGSEAAMHERLGRRVVDESVIIAVEEGELLGFVCVQCVDNPRRRDNTIGFIEYLFVEPAVRERGIGGELLERGEARLYDKGAKVIELDVFESNTDSVAFYRRRGYEVSRFRMRKWRQ